MGRFMFAPTVKNSVASGDSSQVSRPDKLILRGTRRVSSNTVQAGSLVNELMINTTLVEIQYFVKIFSLLLPIMHYASQYYVFISSFLSSVSKGGKSEKS
jgi:hypothetical protein